MSQQPTSTKADRPKLTCHHCKKPGHYRNQCRFSEKQREQTEKKHNNPGNRNSDGNNFNPNSNVNNYNNNNNKNSNRAKRKPKTLYPPCETCGKTNQSTENCYFRANAANRPLPPAQKTGNTEPGPRERSQSTDRNITIQTWPN